MTRTDHCVKFEAENDSDLEVLAAVINTGPSHVPSGLGDEGASMLVSDVERYVTVRNIGFYLQHAFGIHTAVGNSDVFPEDLCSTRSPTQGVT
jgi:hypothetical protein